jgi:murein DD-endopeptidase MepM/ murein hydrolase activator NlpD
LKKKRNWQVPRSSLRDRINKRRGARDSLWGHGEKDEWFPAKFPGQLLHQTNEYFFQKSVAAMLVVILLGLFSLLNFPLTNRLVSAVHYLTVYQMNPGELAGQIQPVIQSVRDINWRRQESPPGKVPDDVEEIMGAPVSGILVSPYGTRQGAAGSDTEMHYGIDVEADGGAPVYAALSGVVSLIQEHPLYGLTIYIKHGEDLVTVYGRCASPKVGEGRNVVRGQQIAVVASSGPGANHLHFEVWKEGEPVDPLEFMGEFR